MTDEAPMLGWPDGTLSLQSGMILHRCAACVTMLFYSPLLQEFGFGHGSISRMPPAGRRKEGGAVLQRSARGMSNGTLEIDGIIDLLRAINRALLPPSSRPCIDSFRPYTARSATAALTTGAYTRYATALYPRRMSPLGAPYLARGPLGRYARTNVHVCTTAYGCPETFLFGCSTSVRWSVIRGGVHIAFLRLFSRAGGLYTPSFLRALRALTTARRPIERWRSTALQRATYSTSQAEYVCRVSACDFQASTHRRCTTAAAPKIPSAMRACGGCVSIAPFRRVDRATETPTFSSFKEGYPIDLAN
ncbi:hypothetical protein FB451DRAFT_1185686 [Mycena latifolia]|nr:hypothetical protein FB451DRAFT_1185686 [Mycena latifolia]